MGALVEYERSRWIAQRAFIGAWLRDLGIGPASREALRSAFAHRSPDPQAALIQQRADLQRDVAQLSVAIEGKSRSAIDPTRTYANTEHFACDEADHAAECVLRFVGRLEAADTLRDATAAVERAQRWLQRLRWELLDTPCSLHTVDLSESALRIVRDDEHEALTKLRTLGATWGVRVAQQRRTLLSIHPAQ